MIDLDMDAELDRPSNPLDLFERLAALNEVQAAVVASLVPPERHTR